MGERVKRYFRTILIMGLSTAGATGLSLIGLTETNVAMVFVLGVAVSAARYGRIAGIVASVTGVALFDFFFTLPHYSLAVEDTEYVVTFLVMLVISIIIGDLTARIRQQAVRQMALADERDRLSREAREVSIQVELERTRSALLSCVSHDLRTPLTGIAGASSTLLDEDQNHGEETKKQLLTTIYEESERLVRLVNNLLSMAQIESGNLTVRKEWQPVEEVIGSALRRLGSELSLHPVRIGIPTNLPLVPFDGVLIEQVLINLLGNAANYTSPGTLIEVKAEIREQYVLFEVADAGSGVPDNLRHLIFEKFFRAEKQTARSHAGLGLAISKAIIEAHNGRVWVQNRPAGGARFCFLIPIDGEPPEFPNNPSVPEVNEHQSIHYLGR
ncbi:MAG: DUF4118 domain-containing protein [Acidobacteriota bacterium]